jgi:hypothetical protein
MPACRFLRTEDAKPKAEVVANILASIKERKA